MCQGLTIKKSNTTHTDSTPIFSIQASVYHSVPGKHPWALKHSLQFWPAWALTQDTSSIYICIEAVIDPLKRALTQEWALARDTMVIAITQVGS